MKVLRFADVVKSGFAASKRVFIRADLNVPQDEAGRITEDTRIRASVPCIQMALDAGAAVMVTSHLGRPTEGAFKPEDSLAPVAKRLGELLGREVPLVANWVDGVEVKPGQLVMLENCRVNVGEKKNDEALARKLAALCDIFVHDAFGTAHLSSLPSLMSQLRWHPDVLFVVEPPLMCSPAALLFASWSRCKTWLHVQDYEVDAAFALGLLRRPWLHRLAQRVEHRLMARFDRVSSISPAMVSLARGKGTQAERVALLPN